MVKILAVIAASRAPDISSSLFFSGNAYDESGSFPVNSLVRARCESKKMNRAGSSLPGRDSSRVLNDNICWLIQLLLI